MTDRALTPSEIALYRKKWVDNWEKTWNECKKDPEFGHEFLGESLSRLAKKSTKK